MSHEFKTTKKPFYGTQLNSALFLGACRFYLLINYLKIQWKVKQDDIVLNGKFRELELSTYVEQ
jgi:hypothetical protein